MNKNNSYTPLIRPLPYYNIQGSWDDSRLAAALRREFVPKVKRLIPGHHLGGFRHDFKVSYIKRHKTNYPCFIRTDIRQFYPSVRHQDIIVGCQVAYRDLLNLRYVPRSFKGKYVGAVAAWCRRLPLHKGIPLGSPLSAILAPIMLLPLWLQIKRRFGVPFIVYMDDVLVCTENENRSFEIYAYIDNYLSANYDLELNTAKTSSGRFSRDAVDFCGWHFAGGYVNVAEEKLANFQHRINELTAGCKQTEIEVFIKLINRKIDGFGHYYKFGHVAGQFRALDMFIRNCVRRWLARHTGRKGYTVEQLATLGIRSLTGIYTGIHNKTTKRKTATHVTPDYPASTKQVQDYSLQVRNTEILEKIHAQLTQLLSLERKQVRMMGELVNMV